MPKKKLTNERRPFESLEALLASLEEAEDEDDADIWRDYDPGRVLIALKDSAGALQGIDHHRLMRDIEAARQQDSRGRPA